MNIDTSTSGRTYNVACTFFHDRYRVEISLPPGLSPRDVAGAVYEVFKTGHFAGGVNRYTIDLAKRENGR